jgi:hypothetical protein
MLTQKDRGDLLILLQVALSRKTSNKIGYYLDTPNSALMALEWFGSTTGSRIDRFGRVSAKLQSTGGVVQFEEAGGMSLVDLEFNNNDKDCWGRTINALVYVFANPSSTSSIQSLGDR